MAWGSAYSTLSALTWGEQVWGEQVRCQRLLLFCLSSLWAVFLVGFGPPVLVDRTYAPTRRLTVGELRRWSEAAQVPPFTADALLLYDVDADRVLFEHDSQLAVPPASLTKLMTALLVLEQGDLQAQVTIQAADLIGGANMGLQVGETLSVEQLLWGLLLPSGNDAAMALARHTAGTVDAFVERMNQRAQQLGLNQTHFVNPHGLDATGHTSSAADLLTLARRDLTYPLFRQIVATSATTVAGHALRNTNELLGSFAGANGVKTGTTDAAGQCLVASITRGGHQVLMVILGSRDRYTDARALYTVYQQNYAWVDGAPNALSVLNRLFAADGHIWYLRALGEPPSLLLGRWGAPLLRAYRRLQLPSQQAWQPGMTVGVLEWRLGDTLVGTQPLVLW